MTSASTLASQQSAFIELLLDDERPMPAGWEERRFDVYRNAYRARIVDAIRDTYPRTERWVGEDAFRRAAIHHAIRHPPNSWTLDAVGEGFSETLTELFSKDPEVAELAWLEWAMHSAFVSADAEPLDSASFASDTSGFVENDWALMALRFLPGTQLQSLEHDIAALWQSLAASEHDAASTRPERWTQAKRSCVVWRHGLKPVFMLIDADEAQMLERMLEGSTYGDACAALADTIGSDAAVRQAGTMLANWIHQGMIVSVSS
jgi:hypothetical protein